MKAEKNKQPDQHTEEELPQHTNEPEMGEPEERVSRSPELTQRQTRARRAELAEMKDKYLRLAAEFENFRRRTAKERIENAKTANQDLMTALLPVMDDLERAQQSMKDATDVEAVKQGVQLVFNKLANTLQQKGLKAMDP